MLDHYGYNLGSFSAGGSLVPDKLSFFISGEGIYEPDENLYYNETLTLPDGLYGDLQNHPQSLRADLLAADGGVADAS